MIALFANKEQPCSPSKRRKSTGGSTRQSPEDEDAVYDVFDTLAETLPRRHRAELQEVLIGSGNGIAYLRIGTQTYAESTENDVFTFFKGEYLRPDGTQPGSPAQRLLKAYLAEAWDADLQIKQPTALQKLSALKNPYAVIVYDNKKGIVFAARDPQGREQMYWGSNSSGDLLFCTDRALLEKSCADADAFPAGTLFISDADSTTRKLVDISSMLEDDEDEHSQLCRSVSRSSLGGMGSRVGSLNQIAAV